MRNCILYRNCHLRSVNLKVINSENYFDIYYKIAFLTFTAYLLASNFDMLKTIHLSVENDLSNEI